MFEKFSRKTGKQQYQIPYCISAHPSTTDTDMMNLALWLKGYGFRADQVQNFYPSPMATATTMYHTGKNPLKRIRRDGGDVPIAKSGTQRKLHKAFLRYHDPQNWPMLRDALLEISPRAKATRMRGARTAHRLNEIEGVVLPARCARARFCHSTPDCLPGKSNSFGSQTLPVAGAC